MLDTDGTREESEGRGSQHVPPKWVAVWADEMDFALDMLDDEEAGRVFKAICIYSLTGDESATFETKSEQRLYKKMLLAAKKCVKDYAKKAEQARQNGKGASKGEEDESQEAETNQQDSNKSPPQEKEDAFSRFDTYFPSDEKIEEQKENAPLPEEDAPLSESVNRLLQGFRKQNGCDV